MTKKTYYSMESLTCSWKPALKPCSKLFESGSTYVIFLLVLLTHLWKVIPLPLACYISRWFLYPMYVIFTVTILTF